MSTTSTALRPQLNEIDRAALDVSFVKGIAWTGAVKWLSQVIAWVSTIFVARMLTPADYGIVGMGGVYLGLVTLLSEFGLGTAIITLREMNEEEVSQIHGLSVLLGVAGFLLSCMAAVPLGRFFGTEGLPLVVVAMSLGFIITSFRTVPQALLQRDLRFKSLALVDGGQAVLLAAGTLFFALMGLGYWTLVLGFLLSGAISTMSAHALRPARFAWPRRRTIGRAVTLGRELVVGRLAWYTYSNADFVVAGRMLGQGTLGAYSFAWTLANVPIEKIASLITRVSPAVLAVVQADNSALRRYVLTLTEGLALATLPLTLGLALVASDLVPLALGEQWAGMVGPLKMLALYASIHFAFMILHTVLIVAGDSNFVMRNSLLAAVALPLAFYFASRWGAAAIAACWVTLYPLLMAPCLPRVWKRIELPYRDYLKALWPGVSSAVLMVLMVSVLKQTVLSDLTPAARVAATVGCGAALYTMSVVTLHRRRLQVFAATLRLIKG